MYTEKQNLHIYEIVCNNSITTKALPAGANAWLLWPILKFLHADDANLDAAVAKIPRLFDFTARLVGATT